MMLYKIASALLEYPDQELKSALPEITSMLYSDAISTEERSTLKRFLQWLDAQDVTDLQASYVTTFDMNPEHSLDAKELPDYLPLILEFASTLEEIEAKVFLGQTVKVLTQLAANLETSESPYAPLIRLIEKRGQLAPVSGAPISV